MAHLPHENSRMGNLLQYRYLNFNPAFPSKDKVRPMVIHLSVIGDAML